VAREELAAVIVMPANTTGIRTGYLAGRFPGKIGHLFSPGAQSGPYEFADYALDNGAFSAYTHGKEWDEAGWIKLLEWAKLSGQRPRWALVPDVVADRNGTLQRWEKYAPIAARYGWPLAFAVQDGMVPADVPKEAEVIFVGGSTQWKWDTVRDWCDAFERVHVGRVNSYRRLWECHEAGAEGCDGAGWFRGDLFAPRKWPALLAYLEESTSGLRRRKHEQLGLTA
jgi:hypothetical protein